MYKGIHGVKETKTLKRNEKEKKRDPSKDYKKEEEEEKEGKRKLAKLRAKIKEGGRTRKKKNFERSHGKKRGKFTLKK